MKFIIEKGSVDCNGDKLNIDLLSIPDTILLTENFDNNRSLGKCRVFKEDGVLKAEAEIPESLLNGFPSIGFKVLKSAFNKEGIYEVQEAELKYVSICKNPNTDPSIKRLSEHG